MMINALSEEERKIAEMITIKITDEFTDKDIHPRIAIVSLSVSLVIYLNATECPNDVFDGFLYDLKQMYLYGKKCGE